LLIIPQIDFHFDAELEHVTAENIESEVKRCFTVILDRPVH